MARTGSIVASLSCASLAALISVTLFAMLLQSPAGWQGAGESSMRVSLLDESKDTSLDPTPAVGSQSVAMADTEADHGGGQVVHGETGFAAYIPASQLTERPQVIHDIDSEWHLPGVPLPMLAAVLLINEYGDVDRIVLDQRSLSPMLETDLRTRFMAMRFSPGRLRGQPVKSALRIEIRLE